MSLEENKVVVQRLYDDLFNRGYRSVADELVAASFVDHGAALHEPCGPAGMLLAVDRLRATVPGGRFTIEDLVAEDDRVVASLVVVGSPLGLNAGGAPPGVRVIQPQMHILRLVGGQVTDLWVVRDDVKSR